MTRQCVYPKDAQQITGKSESYCRELIRRIKAKYNKLKHQFVTAEEFSEYTGIKLETILSFLKTYLLCTIDIF